MSRLWLLKWNSYSLPGLTSTELVASSGFGDAACQPARADELQPRGGSGDQWLRKWVVIELVAGQDRLLRRLQLLRRVVETVPAIEELAVSSRWLQGSICRLSRLFKLCSCSHKSLGALHSDSNQRRSCSPCIARSCSPCIARRRLSTDFRLLVRCPPPILYRYSYILCFFHAVTSSVTEGQSGVAPRSSTSSFLSFFSFALSHNHGSRKQCKISRASYEAHS